MTAAAGSCWRRAMSNTIGIIGSGVVGQTLANGFMKHGYAVMIGTNTPAKRDDLKARTHGKAQIGSFEETAQVWKDRCPRDQGHRGRGGAEERRHRQPRGQDGHRHHQPDRRCAAGEWRSSSTSPRRTTRSWSDCSAAARRGAFREVLQLRRQRVHGQPRLRRGEADDVHLRNDAGSNATWTAIAGSSSDSRRPTWWGRRRARDRTPVHPPCIPGS